MFLRARERERNTLDRISLDPNPPLTSSQQDLVCMGMWPYAQVDPGSEPGLSVAPVLHGSSLPPAPLHLGYLILSFTSFPYTKFHENKEILYIVCY